MEQPLRCNTLKCRAELGDRALVTTCCHIFCLDCASQSGLTSHSPEQHRVCPACGGQLSRPDDAVISNLNPTEDYKISVLSGLSPNVVMECAGRALSFWAYQTTQEIVYQNYLCKNITNKYSTLSVHLDKVIAEANSELTNLTNKLSGTCEQKIFPEVTYVNMTLGMSLENETLTRKSEALAQALKEKSRKLLQSQEMYDKLKRKGMLGDMQDAASEAIDSTLQAAAAAAATGTSLEDLTQQWPDGQQANTSYGNDRYLDSREQHPVNSNLSQAPFNDLRDGGWNRPLAAQNQVPATPSTHRQRVGVTGLGLSTVPGLVVGTPVPIPGSGRMRQPLQPIPQNPVASSAPFPGVGLSSNVKVSRATGVSGGLSGPPGRPRVVQRPGGPFLSSNLASQQHDSGPGNLGSNFNHF